MSTFDCAVFAREIETNLGFVYYRKTSDNSFAMGVRQDVFAVSMTASPPIRAIAGSGLIGAPQNASGTVNYSIGGLNTSTLFTGTITDNNTNANNRITGITKVGTGTLTLSNVLMTYFGPTVFSNGTVVLKGYSGISNSTSITVVSPAVVDATSLDAGALYLGQIGLIQANRIQTLRGNGTIQGNVVLGSNARLEPGFSTGTLTVSGNAQLGGTNLMEIDATAAQKKLVALGPKVWWNGISVLPERHSSSLQEIGSVHWVFTFGPVGPVFGPCSFSPQWPA